MRLLLLIMTGIGFTLGLLCGLLLQLPADGLPAPLHPSSPHHNGRWKRSVGDAVMMTGQKENPASQENVPGGNSESRSALRSSLESNPGMDSDPGVSSDRGTDHGPPKVSGQAERNGVAVKAGQEKGGAEEGKDDPGLAQPVTSFTLRLRNAGGRFVVDSAVQRRVDDTGKEASVGDVGESGQTKDVKTPSGSLNRTLGEVVRGVLWSPTLEDSCPRGVQQTADAERWRRKAGGMEVVRMEEGCGRMQNRLVTFKDGGRACARYRLNTDQIQGEVYSYYLARLLRLPNLPPAVLLPVRALSPQWRPVSLEMSRAQWTDGRLVVLTRWMDRLLPAHIPRELREDDRRLHPTWDVLGKKTVPEFCDLLQWSDLIVFDFLTANLDRVVNNMFNRQWNAEMMSNPAHNLERTSEGSLVFLDNESGLFHGYRLLEKYRGYHEALLSSLCVFRNSTVRAVSRLHEADSVGEELQRVLEEGEVHHKHLPPMPEKNVRVLRDRLARVHEQIGRCRELYGR